LIYTRRKNMNIAVVTEVSTKEKNKYILQALKGTGHTVINAGMTGIKEEPELSYIQTGLISALLLNAGTADLVIGGCGTGQGFLNSAMLYPGVFCGLVESSLDAWLFRQINGGNCLSLALNKGFGWAGDENLRFIFERFFSVESGAGYPPYRREAQKAYRDLLVSISGKMRRTMPELIRILPDEAILPALRFPGVVELVRQGSKCQEILEAVEERLA